MPIVLTDGDFARLGSLDAQQTLKLYRFLVTRLQAAAGMRDVLTVRLPVDVVERVKALAFRHRTNRSEVVRQAIMEFLQRNPI
jgi:hypothetical protein